LWDQNGQLLRELGQRRALAVTCVQFAPNVALLAVGLEGSGGVELWDLTGGDLSRAMKQGRLESAPVNVKCLEFSRDGRLLAAGGEDGRVTFWDLEDGYRSWQMTFPKPVQCLDFWESELVAIGQADGQVVIWNLRDNVESIRFQAHSAPILGLAFAPDGLTLATSAQTDAADGVRLWDTNDLVRRKPVSPQPSGLVTTPTGPGKEKIDPKGNLRLDAERKKNQALLIGAQITLEKAVAQRDSSIKELERIKSLAERAAVSGAELDAARHRLATAEVERRVAEADLAATKARLKAAEIESKIAEAGSRQMLPGSAAGQDPDRALLDSRFEELSLEHLRCFRDLAAAQVTRAKALLDKETVNRDYLKTQLDRTRQLHQRGAVPSQELSNAETELANAEGDIRGALTDLTAAAADLKAAEAELRAFTTRSPADDHKESAPSFENAPHK
jgi:hypothetical protein